MRRFIPLAVLALGALLFAALLLHPPVPAPLETMLDRPIAALTLQALDGKMQMLPQQGRLQIVNVFASWCLPCAAEMPLLAGLKEKTLLLGLAYNDHADKLQAFLAHNGNPYSAVLLDDGHAATGLAITGVPETFLIDRQGIVRWHYAGPLGTAQLAALEQAVTAWR